MTAEQALNSYYDKNLIHLHDKYQAQKFHLQTLKKIGPRGRTADSSMVKTARSLNSVRSLKSRGTSKKSLRNSFNGVDDKREHCRTRHA